MYLNCIWFLHTCGIQITEREASDVWYQGWLWHWHRFQLYLYITPITRLLPIYYVDIMYRLDRWHISIRNRTYKLVCYRYKVLLAEIILPVIKSIIMISFDIHFCRMWLYIYRKRVFNCNPILVWKPFITDIRHNDYLKLEGADIFKVCYS